jgi:hypothetical protein
LLAGKRLLFAVEVVVNAVDVFLKVVLLEGNQSTPQPANSSKVKEAAINFTSQALHFHA